MTRITSIGIETVEDFVAADVAGLLDRLHAIDDQRQYTQVMPALKDMQFCLRSAQALLLALEC